ncbi:MAG: metallophosphoesterase [Candidatus Hydrogenedentes bacterium]|nr:metallophosphoesterase [Candidatus Hydrogenedentota bacterium]
MQLCDTQLGMGGYAADQSRFEIAVESINALKADWVVICGDLVNDGNNDQAVADFQAIARGFEMPCHLAPGNHDVGNEPTLESLKRYRDQYGPDYYAVREGGVKLMIVNTQLWKAPVAGESEAHDRWFREELAESQASGAPTLLVSHYPPFTDNPGEDENYYNLPPATRAEVLELAKGAGVKAWLAGHVHKNLERDFEGIPVIASATTSKNFDGAPYGFRVWTLGGDGALSHRYVALEIPEGRIPDEPAAAE